MLFRIIQLLLSRGYIFFFKQVNLKALHTGIYRLKGSTSQNPKSIFFDFNYSSTHLGDRLFVAKYIRACNVSGIQVLFSKNDTISHEIFSALKLKFALVEEYHYDMRILLLPCLSPSVVVSERDVIISFSEFFNVELTNHLLRNTLGFESYQPGDWPVVVRNAVESNDKKVFFSPYVNSGFFRFIYWQQLKLWSF